MDRRELQNSASAMGAGYDEMPLRRLLPEVVELLLGEPAREERAA